MREFEKRVTEITVLPKGAAIFDERATRICIEDEAGGEYVIIKQNRDDMKPGEVSVEDADWPAIRAAINQMMEDIQKRERVQ